MRMQIGDKADLIHHLLKFIPKCVVSTTLENGLQFIVDGRALLYKFLRPKHSNYADICAMHARHVRIIYGCALVVFDDYQAQL